MSDPSSHFPFDGPPNRLAKFFPVDPGPPEPSAGDQALAAVNRLKIDIMAMPAVDDDPPEVCCEFELHGSLDLLAGNSAELLRSLIRQFRTPRTEGGVA